MRFPLEQLGELMGNSYVIMDVSRLKESRLVRRDQVW